MLFNSFVFIFAFLPLALLGYFALGRISARAAGIWLCASSFVFYAWWSVSFLLLLMASIGFNYLIGVGIMRSEGHESRQNAILTFGIAANLAALIHYKYLFALVGFLDSIGVTNIHLSPIILPLGISFYTFTQIGFLVDTRQGMAKGHGLLEYVLFVSFFPHLIAGPILHHAEIMPQFAEAKTYRFNRENMAVGLTIFVIGLAKKVVIADSLIHVASGGFAEPHALGTVASWLTALSYSLQIYFDFSGYSDMAIGLACMFNVRFPLNFNSPYKALSMIDFWQRWHMTLTRYITLYVYNPIALRNARRRMAKGLSISPAGARTPGGFFSMIAFPTFVAITLAGVWHGAELQFLIFGLLHSAYLIVNHAWRVFGPKKTAPGGPVVEAAKVLVQVLLTYSAVVVAQVFFRAASTGDAIALLSGMIGLHNGLPGVLGPTAFGSFPKAAAMLALYYAIVWIMPNSQQMMEKFPAALGRVQATRLVFLLWQPNLRWAVFTGAAAGLTILSLTHHSEFLYFQF